MRTLRLFGMVVVVVALTWVWDGEARADIIIHESAQEAFGIDLSGDPTGTDPPDDFQAKQAVEAWQQFIDTAEGTRIVADLEASGVTIEIQALGDAEVGGDDEEHDAWGTAQATEWDGDRPTKIVLKIDVETSRVSEHIADTIYHEFRHAEVFINGMNTETRRTLHDRIDADKDALYVRFKTQLAAPPPPPDRVLTNDTPIFSEMRARAIDDTRLGYIAEELGDLFGGSSSAFPETDIKTINGVRVALATEIDRSTLFSGSDCGGSTLGGGKVICPPGAGALDLGDVFGVGMDVQVEIPIENPDTSYQYRLDVLDPLEEIQRSYLLDYTIPGGWQLEVTPESESQSDARAIIEDNTLQFLVPMGEIPPEGDFFAVSTQASDGSNSATDAFTPDGSHFMFPIPETPVPAGCAGAPSPSIFGPSCGSEPFVNLLEVRGMVDPSGSLWLELIFEEPWPMVPPNELFSRLTAAAIQMGDGGAYFRWYVHDGPTGADAGYGQMTVEADLYLTPQGSLVGMLPGAGEPGGYEIIPDGALVVSTFNRYTVADDGTEPTDRFAEFFIPYSLIDMSFQGPPADWQHIEVDIGVVTLDIPEG